MWIQAHSPIEMFSFKAQERNCPVAWNLLSSFRIRFFVNNRMGRWGGLLFASIPIALFF
jgi:hypothetical protein